jgi:hypothetical protein
MVRTRSSRISSGRLQSGGTIFAWQNRLAEAVCFREIKADHCCAPGTPACLVGRRYRAVDHRREESVRQLICRPAAGH